MRMSWKCSARRSAARRVPVMSLPSAARMPPVSCCRMRFGAGPHSSSSRRQTSFCCPLTAAACNASPSSAVAARLSRRISLRMSWVTVRSSACKGAVLLVRRRCRSCRNCATKACRWRRRARSAALGWTKRWPLLCWSSGSTWRAAEVTAVVTASHIASAGCSCSCWGDGSFAAAAAANRAAVSGS